jgi:hypothetical protein
MSNDDSCFCPSVFDGIENIAGNYIACLSPLNDPIADIRTGKNAPWLYISPDLVLQDT